MDKSNMSVSGISTKMFLLFLCITAFFYGMIGNGYILMLLSFMPVFFKLPSITFKRIPLAWIPFVLFALLSSVFSYSSAKTNIFVVMMIMLLAMKMLLENEIGWQRFFFKIFVFLAGANVFATFLSLIAPDMMTAFVKIVYPEVGYNMYKNLIEVGAYPGMNAQTSQTAFFISIYISYLVNCILDSPKKTINYLILAFSLGALFLTQKRSFIIGNLVAALVIFLHNNVSDTKKNRKIMSLFFILALTYVIIHYIPATRGIVDKMTTLENVGDITNGRAAYWSETLMIWRRNPIFGIGANSFYEVYGISVHNVYIQTLVELGVVGFFSLILLLLSSLETTFRASELLRMVNEFDKNDRIICSMSIYMQILFMVYAFFGNPLYGISFILPYTIFVAVGGSYFNYLRGKIVYDENGNINIS